MTNNQFNRAGFTLLEVLIALVIIGGALITVIHSLSYHLSQIERHETITEAVLYGERFLKDDSLWRRKKNNFDSIDNPGLSNDRELPGFSISLRSLETPFPGVILREVTVKKDQEEITMRRLVRQ